MSSKVLSSHKTSIVNLWWFVIVAEYWDPFWSVGSIEATVAVYPLHTACAHHRGIKFKAGLPTLGSWLGYNCDCDKVLVAA